MFVALIYEQKRNVNLKNNNFENNVTKIDNNEETNNNDSDNKKRDEMIKMIEEVNDLYLTEICKIKKLELDLKTFDTKLKKLEKTKKDEIINNKLKGMIIILIYGF